MSEKLWDELCTRSDLIDDISRKHQSQIAEIFREGNKPCPHPLSMLKRECKVCWAELEAKYVKGG